MLPPVPSCSHRQRMRSLAGQRDAEMAAAGPADDAYAAAVGFGELACDGETQARAFDAAAGFRAAAEKRVEDGFALLGGGTPPRIDEPADTPAALRAPGNPNSAPPRGEFPGAANEVVADRALAFPVALHTLGAPPN